MNKTAAVSDLNQNNCSCAKIGCSLQVQL